MLTRFSTFKLVSACLMTLACSAHAESSASALAGQTYAGDSKFLGEFQVDEVFTSNPHGVMSSSNDCLDSQKSSYRCKDLVWAYQKDEALILISRPTQDDIDMDSDISLYDIDCPKFYVPFSETAQKGIFNIGSCQANLPSGNETTASGTPVGVGPGAAIGVMVGTVVPTSDEVVLSGNSIVIHEKMLADSIFTVFMGVAHADHDLVLNPVR